MMRTSALLVVVAYSWTIGCGPSETKPAESPHAATSASISTKPTTPKAPEEDRAPAERPKAVLARIHVTSPASIGRWVEKHWPNKDTFQARFVTDVLGDDFLASLVDLEKPVDIAYVVVGDKVSKSPSMGVLHAFSIGDDIDVAGRLGTDYKIDTLAGGVRKIAKRKPTSGDAHCLVVPALGITKYRLVCSERWGGAIPIAKYAPWLARGVTMSPDDGTSAWGEVDFSEVRAAFKSKIDQFRPELRTTFVHDLSMPDHPQLEAFVKKLVGNAVDDLLDLMDDTHVARLSGTFGDDGAKLALSGTFSSASSWTARVLLAGADGKGTVSAFSKLPTDGWLAAFSRATPAMDTLLHPVEKTSVELVDALAADSKWAKKDRELALEFVRLMFPPSADSVVVAGEGARPDHKVDWSVGDAALLKTHMTGTSWTVMAVDRPAKHAIDLSKALAALLTRPSVVGLVKSLTHDKYALTLTNKELPAPKDLPKGSFANTWDVTLKQKNKPFAHLVAQELIAPDGDKRTFIAHGQNLATATLVTRVLDVMGGKASSTYGGRPGIEYLGGATTSDGFALAVDALIRSFAPLSGAKPEEWLAKVDGGGKGTLMMRAMSTKSGNGGTVEIGAFVPRDLFSLIPLMTKAGNL